MYQAVGSRDQKTLPEGIPAGSDCGLMIYQLTTVDSPGTLLYTNDALIIHQGTAYTNDSGLKECQRDVTMVPGAHYIAISAGFIYQNISISKRMRLRGVNYVLTSNTKSYSMGKWRGGLMMYLLRSGP